MNALQLGEQSSNKVFGPFGCAVIDKPISKAIEQANKDSRVERDGEELK